MRTTRIHHFRLFFWGLLLGLLGDLANHNHGRSSSSSSSSSSSWGVSASVSRPYNLDYLDTETLEYYMSSETREDFDVAVLFYAQWCNKCHSFAPLWDKIARIHHAGTEQSNLIMGLYDCESNPEHAAACSRAGVQGYPTIQFFNLAGKRLQFNNPQHSTKFGGNWNYGDAVYDWLQTMAAMARWHRLGWGRKLRSVFLPFGSKTELHKNPLPKGIPGQPPKTKQETAYSSSGSSSSSSSATNGSGGSGATGSSSTSAASLARVHELESRIKDLEALASRSSELLDSILFPRSRLPSTNDTTSKAFPFATPASSALTANTTDVFAYLNETDGWGAEGGPADLIVSNCAMEIALDYCTRFATKLALQWVDQHPELVTIDDESLALLETYLAEQTAAQEPFCALVEVCIMDNFEDVACRVAECPFHDGAACRYLSSCFSKEIQDEYVDALEKLIGSSSSSTTTTTSSDYSSTESATTSAKPSGKWGM